MNNMDRFISGLTIDEPSLFLSWSATENEIPILLNGHEYKKVKEHYYSIIVTLFDRLFNGCLCLHFDTKGKLSKLELFSSDSDYSNDATVLNSFKETQKILESYLGQPSKLTSAVYALTKSNQNDKEYTWNFKNVKVIHNVWDRFGLEEHLEILLK